MASIQASPELLRQGKVAPARLPGLRSSAGFLGAQQLAAVVNGMKALDLLACLKGARQGIEAHFFVSEDSKVGEHEFRPGLAEVAEKHEAQALAQCGDRHLVEGIGCLRPPFIQRPLCRGELAGAGR